MSSGEESEVIAASTTAMVEKSGEEEPMSDIIAPEPGTATVDESGAEESTLQDVRAASTGEDVTVFSGGEDIWQTRETVLSGNVVAAAKLSTNTTSDGGENKERGDTPHPTERGIPLFINPRVVMDLQDSRPSSSSSDINELIDLLTQRDVYDVFDDPETPTIQRSSWKAINDGTSTQPKASDELLFVRDDLRTSSNTSVVEAETVDQAALLQDNTGDRAGDTSSTYRLAGPPRTPSRNGDEISNLEAKTTTQRVTNINESRTASPHACTTATPKGEMVPEPSANNTGESGKQVSSNSDHLAGSGTYYKMQIPRELALNGNNDSAEGDARQNTLEEKRPPPNDSDDSDGSYEHHTSKWEQYTSKWEQYKQLELIEENNVVGFLTTAAKKTFTMTKNNTTSTQKVGLELTDKLMALGSSIGSPQALAEFRGQLRQTAVQGPMLTETLPGGCYDDGKNITEVGKLVAVGLEIERYSNAEARLRLRVRLKSLRFKELYDQNKNRPLGDLAKFTGPDDQISLKRCAGQGNVTLFRRILSKVIWPDLGPTAAKARIESNLKLGSRVQRLVERFGEGVLCLIPSNISNKALTDIPGDSIELLPEAICLFHPALREWSELVGKYILTDILEDRQPRRNIPLLQLDSQHLSDILAQSYEHSVITQLLSPQEPRLQELDPTPFSTPQATPVHPHGDNLLTIATCSSTSNSGEVQRTTTEEDAHRKRAHEAPGPRASDISKYMELISASTGKLFRRDACIQMANIRIDSPLPRKSTVWMSNTLYKGFGASAGQKRDLYGSLDQYRLSVLARSAILLHEEGMAADNSGRCAKRIRTC
ncbi:hypothetical protein GP486_006509 [Trichoglossum hirsutum]|uniref:Uncharacterized protein n=1 Tax=Trichoglossum hirsutum TaxID=265104 RepID=A0A9P8IH19_9PEZI|nr:hypothetical protein GP486_006509 [Trichoglossum hirsutum]